MQVTITHTQLSSLKLVISGKGPVEIELILDPEHEIHMKVKLSSVQEEDIDL
jgi:hypothetical protein